MSIYPDAAYRLFNKSGAAQWRPVTIAQTHAHDRAGRETRPPRLSVSRRKIPARPHPPRLLMAPALTHKRHHNEISFTAQMGGIVTQNTQGGPSEAGGAYVETLSPRKTGMTPYQQWHFAAPSAAMRYRRHARAVERTFGKRLNPT